MRLISYHTRDHAGIGAMVDDWRFVSLRRAAPSLPQNLKALIEAGPEALRAASDAVKGREPDSRLDLVTLDPVIPDPHAIWALALNFKAHIEETGLTTSKDYPQIFMRMPCSQV